MYLSSASATEEGILSFWKGNGVNVIRVAPYAAAQLSSNDVYKKMLADDNGRLGLKERLTAGALAGMTAAVIMTPVDVVKTRLMTGLTMMTRQMTMSKKWMTMTR